MKRFAFSELPNANLVVDAIYESDRTAPGFSGEPLGPLTRTGNQGGFRFCGPKSSPKLVVLYTTLDEPDWPDAIDEENGLFVYYGDNRKPGFELHDPQTGRGGNHILRRVFELAHAGPSARAMVPPFLIFSKGNQGRDVVFRGLAVPGANHLDASADLVATWKSADGHRFQNYRAVFTFLDVGRVDRSWLEGLLSGHPADLHPPLEWTQWVKSGKAKALQSEKITRVRSATQQLGSTPQQRIIAGGVYEYFAGHPVLFEHFAADVARMMDPNIVGLDVTRPSRDGGRDGIGRYRIGQPQNCVTVDFALEAKCYAPQSGLGVKVVSRLISRLRHRQFGVLVTTSYLADQAYKEIIEDNHPIVICSGGDIADLLIEKAGLGTINALRKWLSERYPVPAEG